MYYIVYGFLYLISLLPFFILYGIADIIFVLIYFVFGYRKKIVMGNLRNSFPEKTDHELKVIARKFYRNFIDNWIETIKIISISNAGAKKMITGNFEIFDELYKTGKSCQVVCGHQFNWEMYNISIPARQPFTFLGIYMVITNKVLDKIFIKLRSKFGTVLLPATDMKNAMELWRDKQYLIGLGSDQSPGNPESGWWLYYLNQPTGFVRGPAKNAKNLNQPVVFSSFTKTKRGVYNAEFKMLVEEPAKLEEAEITKLFVRELEAAVHRQPEIYLWSHRRWKHKWKPEYKKYWVDDKPAPDE